MVLIRNNVKKESTYGWYPPQVNIYQNPRENVGYDKDLLFRHIRSQLHPTHPTAITPPETPFGVKKMRAKSATPQRGSRITVTRPKTATTYTGENPLDKLRIQGLKATAIHTPDNIYGYTVRPTSSKSRAIPTPTMTKKTHWQPQPTIIGVVDPDGPFISKSPEIEESNEGSIIRPRAPIPPEEDTEEPELEYQNLTPAQKLSGSFRVKSASLHRPKVSPTRSIKSAGSRAKSAVVRIPLDTATAKQLLDKDENQRNLTSTSYWNQVKHEMKNYEAENEMPVVPESSPRDDDVWEEDRMHETNYDEQGRRYGWRMEVHGDPFRLKQAVLPERLPYAVECDEPNVKESPYNVKVMVGETFFYNTIPRQRMTFAVHPEWQSEHFIEKRKELEKQGRTFHTRNYGFVY